MVSAKALLALCAISGIVHSYPIHRPTEGSSEPDLTTRSPSPRFRNPFDVDSYLRNLDYEIPNNKDIQGWVKAARKKGALAAAGKFSGDNDEGEDEEEDHDDDHDDEGEEQHNTKATPRVSEEDDDDQDEDNHNHDQHKAKSVARTNGDEHDDDKDNEDEENNLQKDEAAQPIQSVQPARPTTTTESSTPTATPTITDSNAAVPTPTLDHESDGENNIEVMQPVQSGQPSQPSPSAQDSSAPTTAPSSTAPSIDALTSQPSDETEDDEDDEDDEDGTNQVMQPNNAQDSATPTIPSETISGDDAAAAPAVQTVYVPVNVFPTQFPNFPDIDDDEKPSASSKPLPVFPPPEDITEADLPPPAEPPSPEENTDTNGPEVAETPVAEDTTTTPDVTTTPEVAESPMNEEPASEDVESMTNPYPPRPQMPSHEAQLSKVSELLDMFTPKDESEESY